MLRFFNSLGREKQTFKPINPKRVTGYFCGPTVYDTPHLGNIRAAVVADMVYRVLAVTYGLDNVVFVKNITDIDDKIITRALELGVDINVLTEETVQNYHRAERALNILPPTVEPFATDHVPDMITMIEILVAKNHAYVSNGHVYFAINSAPFHGLLSGQDSAERRAGERIEISPNKRNPADFVLWKPSDAGLPGWDSPWGFGRPGWHIECSAMIRKHLGETIDIHGGGEDLIFPHHENERTQSECTHGGVELANYWLHNGMVLHDGRKMSKSLGNFVTVDDALARYPGEAVRMLILLTHYRKPLDFSWARLADAKAIMDKFYRALQDVWEFEYRGTAEVREYPAHVLEKLEDDLNTSEAVQVVHMMADNALNAQNAKEKARLKLNLIGAGKLLGILQMTPDEWFHQGFDDVEQIDALIAKRNEHRAAKEWVQSDQIRNDLAQRGIYLEDKPDKTIWRGMK